MTTDYPQDNENTIYLEDNGGISMDQINKAIEEKWPGVNPAMIEISAEHRHVTCLTYDLYDPTDYQDYIVITKI